MYIYLFLSQPCCIEHLDTFLRLSKTFVKLSTSWHTFRIDWISHDEHINYVTGVDSSVDCWEFVASVSFHCCFSSLLSFHKFWCATDILGSGLYSHCDFVPYNKMCWDRQKATRQKLNFLYMSFKYWNLKKNSKNLKEGSTFSLLTHESWGYRVDEQYTNLPSLTVLCNVLQPGISHTCP